METSIFYQHVSQALQQLSAQAPKAPDTVGISEAGNGIHLLGGLGVAGGLFVGLMIFAMIVIIVPFWIGASRGDRETHPKDMSLSHP